MPTLKLDGDASGAVKATGDVGNAARKLDQEFKNVGLSADQIRTQLEKAMNEKPIDTYIRKCDELAKKLVDGKMTASQYAEQTDRLAKGLKQTGDAHGEAFGGAAINKATEMAAAYLSIEKAVEFVTEGIRAMAEEAHEAGERTKESLRGASQLVQASRTPEDFAANNEETDRLRKLGIDTNQAQAISGAMGKAKMARPEQAYIESALHDQRLSTAQTPAFIENVRGFQDAFPKAGSFQDVSRQAMEASRYSLRFSPDEILGLALKAKEGGAEVPSDQLLATIGQIGRTTPQAKKAASAAEKFLTQGDSFEGKQAAEYGLELQRVQSAAAKPDVDYIAGNKQMNAARIAEESEASKKLAEEKNLGEPERLGQSIYSARTARASGQGRWARFQEGMSQRLDTRSWQKVIEDEATGHQSGDENNINHPVRVPFADIEKEEDREAIKDYLRRIAESAEKSERSPPPPNGRQE